MKTDIARSSVSAAIVLLLFTAGAGLAMAQLQGEPLGRPAAAAPSGGYIIRFQPGTSPASRAASVSRAGAILRFNYDIVDAAAVTIPNANALAALQRDASVLEIIPDRAVRAFQGKSGAGGKPPAASPGQITPQGVLRVGVPGAGSDGSGVGVAIMDTGMDLGHADLSPGAQTYSAFGASCQDQHGHATHVTGIVAALNNNIDTVGVAPGAKAYCVQVLDRNGSGTDSTVLAGLNWIGVNATSVSPPIRVANMSLGREGTLGDNTVLRQAVQALYNDGIVIVVAAGNDPNREVENMVPATYPEVLAVASTTAVEGTNGGCRFFPGKIPADTASYFTTDGLYDLTSGIGVTVSGPGADQENVSKSCFVSSVGILSLKLGGGTTRMSGTSMASPHVAGIVARMIQAGGFVANSSGVENIRSNLRNTADRKGVAPLNSPTSSYSFDGEREGVGEAP